MRAWRNVGGWASLIALVASAVDARPNGLPHGVTTRSERALRAYFAGREAFYRQDWSAAIAQFERALRADPHCLLAHWALARTRLKQGELDAARAALAGAQQVASAASDREQQFVAILAIEVEAAGLTGAERTAALARARRQADVAISLYPTDSELWAYRGDLAERPVRALPFYRAALRLEPGHPGGHVWDFTTPPLPTPPARLGATAPPLAAAPKRFDGLGILHHPVTTRSPEALAYYEQGLRLYHSYVYGDAVRCFQYACQLDPHSPMFYWGLSRALSRSRIEGITAEQAAFRAVELAANAPEKERWFVVARALEVSGAQQQDAFLDTLDAAIARYPDDPELWVWRGRSLGDGAQAAIPYHLAALQVNPDHPSANHELVHAYEGTSRPALGWPYTIAYRRSAPNMPHAHHMQAHLAMRLGRWDTAIECTGRSVALSKAGFPDSQQPHHVDIMARCLLHQGRFAAARAEEKIDRNEVPWARILLREQAYDELFRWVEAQRRSSPAQAAYIAALAHLDRGELDRARDELARLEALLGKTNPPPYALVEVRGRVLVHSGRGEEGLQVLREGAARVVTDYSQHAWGQGSIMLEAWGEAALAAGAWAEAEEAFLEGLAHEHGSVISALGLQVVAEQLGRPELVAHYAARAREIWKRADPGALERELARMRRFAAAGALARRQGGPTTSGGGL